MTKNENIIRLNQFLKWQGIADTGGQAKLMIQGGEVLVNGIIETRRGRQLVSGDSVTVGGETFEVDLNNAWYFIILCQQPVIEPLNYSGTAFNFKRIKPQINK